MANIPDSWPSLHPFDNVLVFLPPTFQEYAYGVRSPQPRTAPVYLINFRSFANDGITVTAQSRATGFGVGDLFCFTTRGTQTTWVQPRLQLSSII